MKRKLRYGMVGGGPGAFIGAAHRRAVNLEQNAALCAGCFSRSFDKTLKTGRLFGVDESRLYHTAQEMAAEESKRDDPVDFAVIVTPNHDHYDSCLAFLKVGIPVVCDKPLVCEEEQAIALTKLAKDKGLLCANTYTYSGHVTAKQARALVRSGAIGEVRMIMGEYPQGWLSSGDGGKQGLWRCDPDQSGATNVLGDLGTHIENTVSFITGLSIRRVLAKMDVMAEGRRLDDNSTFLLEYSNGASGVYWVSQIALGCDNDLKLRIFGSRGTIEWEQNYSEDLYVTGEDGVRRRYRRGYGDLFPSAAKYARLPSMHTEGYLEALSNIYRNYCECLQKQQDGTLSENDIEFPTFDDGLNGVKFIRRCLESSNNGNIWVNF